MPVRKTKLASEEERAIVPSTYPLPEELARELIQLGKDFQEFKAVTEERERLKEAFRRRELTYITIIISMFATIVVLLIRLLNLT